MASTNKTSNLVLSQFIATDTPTWLVDYNGDMEKIDAGVGRVKELAETASTQAVGVASGLQATNQTVTTLSGQVANVQNQANTTTASVNGINQRLGNADISGIGNGTITGAIVAINAQNSNLNWNLIDTVTGANTISYDASLYKEIQILVIISGGIKFVNTFQTDIISESSQDFILGGYYKSNTANGACIVALSKTSAKISTITQNGTDKSTDVATSISLYGR